MCPTSEGEAGPGGVRPGPGLPAARMAWRRVEEKAVPVWGEPLLLPLSGKRQVPLGAVPVAPVSPQGAPPKCSRAWTPTSAPLR